ncbi:MAG: hypothetical protein HYU84_09950 [Chloroflexi bacterium]|nr:hypothetical protein [Chloroflexota bacterium]
MEGLFCGFAIAGIIVISLFFYLLNTARKKVKTTNDFGKKVFAPVYVSIADKPDSIIRGMNKFVAEVQKTETSGDKWRWIPLLIFFAGIGMALVDVLLFLLGYSSFIFIIGGVLLWVAAIVMARSLRKSDILDFSPRYKGTKEILHTLRDDLKPGSTFLGHLDLTGSMLKTKVARETQDSQKRTTQLFNDPWLSLKAKLYDGNILRVTALQKTKKRIVVNPEAYAIKSNNLFSTGKDVGKYKIEQLSTEGGMINILAVAPFEEVAHSDILTFLKSAYSLLERKAA